MNRFIKELHKYKPLIHPLAEEFLREVHTEKPDNEYLYWTSRMSADFLELYARESYKEEDEDFHIGVAIVLVSDILRELSLIYYPSEELKTPDLYEGVVYLEGDRDPSSSGNYAASSVHDTTNFWDWVSKEDFKHFGNIQTTQVYQLFS